MGACIINRTAGVVKIDQTYNSTSANAQSGVAVTQAINALDGTISGTAGAAKTLTAFSQTNGKVSATFGNISITKSQVSDFSHTHGNIANDGKVTATAAVASGDKIAIVDSSDSSKITGGPQFGTNSTQYLANNGSWGTPTGTYSKTSFGLLRNTSDTSFSSGEIVSASAGSPYNIIYVELYDVDETGWRVVGSGLVFKGYSTQICNTWSNYYGLRTVTFNSTGQVTISAHTAGSEYANSLVPRRVWGIK